MSHITLPVRRPLQCRFCGVQVTGRLRCDYCYASNGTPIVYCTPKCKDQDRIGHEPYCSWLWSANGVWRKAQILMETWKLTRELTFEQPYWGVFQFRQCLMVVKDTRAVIASYNTYAPPAGLNEADKWACMMYNACDDAHFLMWDLIVDMLGDDLQEMKWILLKPIPVRPTELYNNPRFYEPRPAHSVLKIKLRNGQQWVLDLTGAQYGFTEFFVPYHIYKKKCRRGYEVELDELEELNRSVEDPVMDGFFVWWRSRRQVLRSAYVQWMIQSDLDLAGVVRLPEPAFVAEMQRFVWFFDRYLQSH